MTNGPWRPMGQTAAEAGSLHEGIPPWAKRGVWDWIYAYLNVSNSPEDLVDVFDQMRRAPRPIAPLVERSGLRALEQEWDDEADVLPFLDFLIRLGDRAYGPTLTDLNILLERVGSAWKVGTRDGFPGLERRVPKGVQEAADQAMAIPDHAGARLSEAWHKLYGISPDPSSAYSLAVKAVEDATVPVVVPKQAGATLGHVIGQLTGDGDWRLPLTREDPAAPTAETIVRMCKALWKGHHDRHGGDQTTPKSVNQDEAEAAVHMAVFLVQGFASGLIARR